MSPSKRNKMAASQRVCIAIIHKEASVKKASGDLPEEEEVLAVTSAAEEASN